MKIAGNGKTISPQTDFWRHTGVLASVDFTTIEILTKSGLVTRYLRFVMESATRRVHFAGCASHPDEFWASQAAKILTDAENGFVYFVGSQVWAWAARRGMT